MLTPEFENSAYAESYNRKWQKKFVDNEYTRIENAIHAMFGPDMPIVWHGIFDPLTSQQNTTTATNQVQENAPCNPPKLMDADTLELQMLENELAEIEDAIRRKNEHHKKVMDLKLRIAEAKQLLDTI